MTNEAQKLNLLTKKRKQLVSLLEEKKKSIEHSISMDINSMRADERKKRIEIYGQMEEERQQITSALIYELMKICDKDQVPRYIVSIAKILDNYQGGINTIRSNSNWLSEIVTQLTDQMRNFDAGQTKLNAKFDLILDKVNKSILSIIMVQL